MAKAYSADGQAASALHIMALLQAHQAKALKHKGGADSGVLQKLISSMIFPHPWRIKSHNVCPGLEDNTATVAYINHQGCLCSHRMSHIPGGLNRASNKLSFRKNGDSSPNSPADLEMLRRRSGRPVCLPEHVPLPGVILLVRGDPWHGCTGTQLASGPTQICVSPSEPSRTDTMQSQGGSRAGPLGGAVLPQSDLVPQTNAPHDSPFFANLSEEGSPFSERGHPLAPMYRLVESPHVVPGWDANILGGLPPAVVNTITSARAPSTRHASHDWLKWNLFFEWCSSLREGPCRCPIMVVLSFLQDGLERRLSPSTLKVYVLTITAQHDAVDGKSVGKYDLVIKFLRGARRLNTLRPHLVPSWDLPLVLAALRGSFWSLCCQ